MKRKVTLNTLVILSMRTVLSFFVFVIFLFTVPIFNEVKASFYELPKSHIVIGETSLVVGVADTTTERIQGLSGRESMEYKEGLLFIFDELDFHSIWMKEMNFSIDIIWLNNLQQVMHIEKDVSPDTYPESFRPDQKSRYVLEVSSGFVQKEGIKIGDQMTIL